MNISVVMASRNPEKKKLAMAVNSILNQSYRNFDLIIVDDGSDAPIEPLVKSISQDEKIRVYRIEHSGLGAALNYGIKQTNAKYIARLDDDDLMCKERLQKQFDYMEAHPEVSCLGTQHYDKVGCRYRKHRYYHEHHDDMVKSMLTDIRLCMAHTTFLFRNDSFDKIGGYRIAGGGQDADLILQMSRVGKLANLSEYLGYYTMSTSGLGTVNPNKYMAYLFAFEEILKQDIYPQYEKQIESSISRIKNQISIGNKRVVKNIIARKILALRIILLGKTFKLKNM